MLDLYVRSITGKEEMLVGFEVARTNSVNGEKYISVTGKKAGVNSHAYSLIQNQNTFIYDDEEYVITKNKERTRGKSIICESSAIHRAFVDLKKRSYIYDTVSKTLRIEAMLEFSLKGSGYTFSVDTDGLPLSVLVDNFGDDNSLNLLQKTMEKFGAEYEIVGKHIYVAKGIGRYLDNQFRHEFNIKDPTREIDTNEFYTFIRGFGKQNEDDGSYVVTAEYRSPLADIYGILIAKPVRDDRYTDHASLLERLKRDVNDSINISLELTYIQMQEIGLGDVRKGDYVWCIIDPFDIDVRVRIMEVEDYSNLNKSPVYRIGTIKQKATDVMVDLKASQQATKKDINDTKVTVIQTQQTVTKAVEDISNATIDVTEMKSTIEQTNKTVSKQGSDIRSLEQAVQTLETSVGGIEIPVIPGVATEKNDGLMSAADKKKLNLIKYTGQAEVDLSILVQKNSELEQEVTTLKQQNQQLDNRLKVLEGNKPV